MFSVSKVNVLRMFGDVHIDGVGGGRRCRGTGHVDPGHVAVLLLLLRLRHPGLVDSAPRGLLQDGAGEQVGGGGHAGEGGGDGDGPGRGGAGPLSHLGRLHVVVTVTGLFIAQGRHSGVLRAEGRGGEIYTSITHSRPDLAKTQHVVTEIKQINKIIKT